MTLFIRGLKFIDVPFVPGELEALQARIQHASDHLRRSNAELREAIANGDEGDLELATAVLDNEEILVRNDLRCKQIASIVSALRDAETNGLQVRIVNEVEWESIANSHDESRVVLDLPSTSNSSGERSVELGTTSREREEEKQERSERHERSEREGEHGVVATAESAAIALGMDL